MNYEHIFKLLTEEYSLLLATSPEDFQAVKDVRREVFSNKYVMSPDSLDEKGYLFNKDDEQSFIYLLRHNPSSTYVGTVRAFFINEQTPIKLLPMQKDGNVKDIHHLTLNFPIVEISRGALIQNLPTHPTYSALKLRTMLTYSLMISTRINFLLYHCSRVFSIMERPLYQILKRQDVNFEQAGETVDYYGMCIPFSISWGQILKDTEINMGEITRYYLKELCNNPEPFWKFIDENPYLERSDMQLDRICKLFEEHGDDVKLSQLLGESYSVSNPMV